MARGIARLGRTPRESVRDRRNAQRLGGAASLMFGDALAINDDGQIVLNLQTLSGLDQDTTGLTVVVQDVLAIDASGIKLNFGTGLQSVASTLTTKDSEIVHDNLSGFVGNEHIDHTSVTITTGVGLSGGGDISSNRTFDIDILGLTTDTIAAGDWVVFHDLADEANKIAFSDFEATLAHNNLAGIVANEHIDWTNANQQVKKIQQTFHLYYGRNVYTSPELEFLTDNGGHQVAQFQDALRLLEGSEGQAIRIAILDGVVWIKSRTKMYRQICEVEQTALSALLLEDFLESLG